MARNRLEVCDLWDVTSPALPPRSRLYHLAPIGVGTPDVESLTGYVARLAEAHNVSTLALVKCELLPLLGKECSPQPGRSSLSSFWTRSSRALNGPSSLAKEWTQVLERVTMRNELRFLTLQPWAEVLTFLGLMRHTRAWCPTCYEEWREAGQQVYEPLLWAVAVVTVCPRHSRRLSNRCSHPDCGQALYPLESRSRPGYCSKCQRWLGIPMVTSPADEESLDDEETKWQLWMAESVGELLAAAPTLSVLPRRERIAQAMTVCVEQAARGTESVLAQALGLRKGGAWEWLHEGVLPRLDLLLRLCDLVDISLLDFLTKEDLRVGSLRTDRPWMHISRPQAPPRRPFDAPRLRQALEQVLADEEQPPPSMREVGRRLKYRAPDLYMRFPELCSAISARYKTYRTACARAKNEQLCIDVREAVLKLHAQGLYPSGNRVAALLKIPRSLQAPDAWATFLETRRELGW